MQQDISSSSMTPNMSRMSQITGLSDMFSSTPYSSIFFQSDRFGASPTPLSRSSSEQRATSTTTAAVASLSRLMSEHSDLTNRFSLCLSQLKKTFKEAETLRQENTNLRLANHELSRQINLLLDAAALQTEAAYSDPLPLTDGKSSSETNTGGGGLEEGFENISISDSPTSVIDDERSQLEVEAGRVSLPKSISIRSNGYLKISPGSGSVAGSSGSSSEAKLKPRRGGSSKTRSTSPVSGPQKVYVQGGKTDGTIEMDVFNQGMFKTELCNKWQDTGSCPYGDHCQFAHGIKELRPVIRHPRYKTEVCRMVLAGVTCPYGHRCHFRHALTPEEQAMLPLRLE